MRGRVNAIRTFKGLVADLRYYSFSSTDNNDVKFQIEFFKHTSSDDHTPNTIGFMFNPVKIDGVWYLAVKEATKEATDK